MNHQGYSARIEYSEEDGCFVGHIAGIRDVVGFHGESVAELRAAFAEAVDDYLATCAKAGIAPQVENIIPPIGRDGRSGPIAHPAPSTSSGAT